MGTKKERSRGIEKPQKASILRKKGLHKVYIRSSSMPQLLLDHSRLTLLDPTTIPNLQLFTTVGVTNNKPTGPRLDLDIYARFLNTILCACSLWSTFQTTTICPRCTFYPNDRRSSIDKTQNQPHLCFNRLVIVTQQNKCPPLRLSRIEPFSGEKATRHTGFISESEEPQWLPQSDSESRTGDR